MDFRAVQRNARISPRKVSLSADLIRGRRVEDAINALAFDKRRSSDLLRKVLESAVANASSRGGRDPMDLVVAEAHADKGITIKRHRACGRGRANGYVLHTCHITVVVK